MRLDRASEGKCAGKRSNRRTSGGEPGRISRPPARMVSRRGPAATRGRRRRRARFDDLKRAGAEAQTPGRARVGPRGEALGDRARHEGVVEREERVAGPRGEDRPRVVQGGIEHGLAFGERQPRGRTRRAVALRELCLRRARRRAHKPVLGARRSGGRAGVAALDGVEARGVSTPSPASEKVTAVSGQLFTMAAVQGSVRPQTLT